MSKPRIARLTATSPPDTGTPEAQLKRLRHATKEQVEALADLTLDQVAITTTWPGGNHEIGARLVLTGEDLARLVSIAEAYPGGAYGLTESGDVNLRLKGLAELISGHYGTDGTRLDKDAAYFLSVTLEDLAARLEAGPASNHYRAALVRTPAAPKVAS
jgi:hypothetical protein